MGFNDEAIDEMVNIPVGQLGIIALPGCEEMAQRIDQYIPFF